MKTKNKLIGGLATIALGATLFLGPTKEVGCKTFQDYNDEGNGTRIALFGPSLDSITYSIEVEGSAIDENSEKGKKYNPRVKDYLLLGEVLVTATPCDIQ
jgi:uncharacterized protein (DUF488 family)